ncbi:retrovirus-related pol polyprotein from transposon TNT 1-94, partial [Tanacetum coccineum]
MESIKPRVLAPSSVETLREIVEEAKVERPFDRSLASACLYTKHSQELLEYAIGTCPNAFNQRDKNHAPTPIIRKKQVTFDEQCETSNSNTHKHVEQLNTQKTNVPVPPSTGVNCCTNASRSQPRSNTKKNRISPAKGVNKKKVEEHPRINMSNLRTTNHVDSSSSSKRILSKFGNLSKLGKYGNPQEKCLPVLVINGDLRVYYVEGIGHNLLSVRQFCDSDLEVAFRKHSYMMKSSPICLLSKASMNKSWLWHRRLNHLNFGTINDLVRKDLVRGLPGLKYEKDHLCYACQLGKSKKHTYKPKTKNTNLEVLNTFHMDLCGPMRVQTINEEKYILVIVDDYSRFSWVKFLRSKDEIPEVVIKFLKQIQVGLNKTNSVVERQNRTLLEATRTMLIFSKALMFLWAEAVATACYTQNRSLIYTLHNKTSYELVHDKKPDLTFFRVFGALCYPTNDSKDLGKLQLTTDIGIFVGYAPSKKG